MKRLFSIVCGFLISVAAPMRAGTIAVIDTPAGAAQSSVIFFNSTTLTETSSFTAPGVLSDLTFGAGLDIYATMGAQIMHYDPFGDLLGSAFLGYGNSLGDITYLNSFGPFPQNLLVIDQSQGQSSLLIADGTLSTAGSIGVSPVAPVSGFAYDGATGIYLVTPNTLDFFENGNTMAAPSGDTFGDASFGAVPGAGFLFVTGTSAGAPVVFAVAPGLGSIVPVPVSNTLQSIAAGSSSQFFEIFGTSGNQLFDEGALVASGFSTLNSYTGAANDNFTDVSYTSATNLVATPEPATIWTGCGALILCLGTSGLKSRRCRSRLGVRAIVST